MTLLRVEELTVKFESTDKPTVHAVNGPSFTVKAGERVALVGESGCGKSVTALSIMNLLDTASVKAKTLSFANHPSLLDLRTEQWQEIRGNQISMVFQDPGVALNPAMRVDRQVSETIERHTDGISRVEATQQAHERLTSVGIGEDHWSKYPHEMSGGQRQRVMIAIAIACDPKLLIADEPTTALDVTTQAKIVELVKEVSRDMAVIWITHDLALAATLVDRVLVMYAGQIVEEAPVRRLFESPAHPYTRALLQAIPSLASLRGQPLQAIDGAPPDLKTKPVGCSFYDRCSFRRDACREATLVPERQAEGHYALCIRTEAVRQESRQS